MALIHCPECGGKMSDQSRVCPHCGFPIPEGFKNDVVHIKITSSIHSTVRFNDLHNGRVVCEGKSGEIINLHLPYPIPVYFTFPGGISKPHEWNTITIEPGKNYVLDKNRRSIWPLIVLKEVDVFDDVISRAY